MQLSVKNKLIALLVFSAGASLLTALVSFTTLEVRSSLTALEGETQNLARMIGLSSRAALAFDDKGAATNVLQSLSARDHIEAATLYTAEGATFASYVRTSSPTLPWITKYMVLPGLSHEGHLSLHPIELHGTTIGSLHIRADYSPLYKRLAELFELAVLLFVGVLCLSILLAQLLHRVITNPLSHLMAATRKVAESGDYSLRLPPGSDDEIGLIHSNFNEMLSQIERRDDELVHARDRAESADNAKSLFLANVSHEVRTPLNGIMGMTQLVLGGSQTEEDKKCLEVVMQCSRTLLDIVNDMLDLTKIERGEINIFPERFALRRSLDIALSPLRALAEEKDTAIEVLIDDEIPDALIADFNRIYQLVSNLVNNAIRFSPAGKTVTISVNAENQEEDEFVLSLQVRDEGPGIPAELQQKIFDPFYQVDQSTTREIGGAGLGLAICRNLAESMGGSIGVESTRGEGATFTLRVPVLLHAEEITHFARGAMHEDLMESLRKFGPLSALIVEDNAVGRQLVKSYLEKVGFTVYQAENGSVALESFKNNVPDIICMDCQMPEMDGFTATQKIRELEREMTPSRRTPVIALTAYAMTGDRERCLNSGMDSYIPKPIDVNDLYLTIRHLLKRFRTSEKIKSATSRALGDK